MIENIEVRLSHVEKRALLAAPTVMHSRVDVYNWYRANRPSQEWMTARRLWAFGLITARDMPPPWRCGERASWAIYPTPLGSRVAKSLQDTMLLTGAEGGNGKASGSESTDDGWGGL